MLSVKEEVISSFAAILRFSLLGKFQIDGSLSFLFSFPSSVLLHSYLFVGLVICVLFEGKESVEMRVNFNSSLVKSQTLKASFPIMAHLFFYSSPLPSISLPVLHPHHVDALFLVLL